MKLANVTINDGDVNLTVGKKSITVTITCTGKKYDGNTIADNVVYKVNGVVADDDIDASGTSATYSGTDVGSHTVTATGITLNGTKKANYSLTKTSATVSSVAIRKGNYNSNPITATMEFTQHTAHNGAITVADLDLPKEFVNAAISSVAEKTDTSNILTLSGTNNTSYAIADTAAAGNTATCDVTISSKNYENCTVTLNFNIIDKSPVKVTGVTVANKGYNGKPANYSGTPVAKTSNGTTVSIPAADYDYIYYLSDGTTKTNSANSGAISDGAAPKNAGSYNLLVFVKNSNTTYSGNQKIPFTIDMATITITAKNRTAYVGDALPVLAVTDYTVTGLASGETFNMYDVAVTYSGPNTVMRVYSSQGSVARVERLPNGKYRVTGLSAGQTYLMFEIYDRNGKLVSHASVKIVVDKNTVPGGQSNRAYSLF